MRDGDDAEPHPLTEHLASLGCDVSNAHVAGQRIWQNEVGFDEARVPGDIVRDIARYLSEVRL